MQCSSFPQRTTTQNHTALEIARACAQTPKCRLAKASETQHFWAPLQARGFCDKVLGHGTAHGLMRLQIEVFFSYSLSQLWSFFNMNVCTVWLTCLEKNVWFHCCLSQVNSIHVRFIGIAKTNFCLLFCFPVLVWTVFFVGRYSYSRSLRLYCERRGKCQHEWHKVSET